VTQSPFYGYTAPGTRKELISKLYAEVQRQLSGQGILPSAQKAAVWTLRYKVKGLDEKSIPATLKPYVHGTSAGGSVRFQVTLGSKAEAQTLASALKSKGVLGKPVHRLTLLDPAGGELLLG
jgi:hypothetical protein